MSKFPNQNSNSIEKKAKSVEEAIAEALSELGISKEEAIIDVIQEPSKGFLGLGAKEAIVRVSAKNTESAVDEPAEKITVPEVEKAAEADVQAEPEEATTDNSSEDVIEAVSEVAPKASKGGIYSSESPAENAKNFISDILKAMGLEVEVSAVLEDDIVKVNLEGENMGIVIGKRGDTLDSLQYLTSLVVNQSSEGYIKISIDTENYREKRSEALEALSDRLAAKVARTGKKFTLEPMNPYERRIIHSNLQDNEDVTTFSIGQEPYRKVVIAPKHPKQYGRKGGYGKRKRPSSGGRGGYSRPSYERHDKQDKHENKSASSSVTYKADFKPQQHKAEYKNFEEYLAAHSKD